MSDLPTRPLAKIIRAADAASWIDGYAFLAQAKSEAETIRDGAEAEVAKACEAGLADGRRQGEAEAARLLMHTEGEVDRYLASVEPRMVELALDIIRQVLGSFDDSELVARAARRALETLRDDAGIVVHVAPDLVAEIEAQLGREGGLLPALRVAADRHLSGRQCIITTPATSIDVGIDAQMDAIRAVMTASVRNAA